MTAARECAGPNAPALSPSSHSSTFVIPARRRVVRTDARISFLVVDDKNRLEG